MGLFILLTMIAVPIMEIAVFIQAGDLIGLWPTLAVVVLTAIVGTALLRAQGLATLRKVQESMEAGRPPLAELFDGLCLLIAGALLLTPGFVTDGVGLLLFFPPFRSLLLAWLSRRIVTRGTLHESHMYGAGAHTSARRPGEPPQTTIIEGEFHEITDADIDDEDGPQANKP